MTMAYLSAVAFISFAAFLNYAICRSLDILINGDRTDGVGNNPSRHRVLDIGDDSFYIGIQRGIFKRPVAGGIESAVFQNQVVCITERLLTRDMAVHKVQVFRVLAKIFPIQLGIIDGHVLHFPKGILGRNLRMVYLHILHVSEYVFAIAFHPVHIDVIAEHERVSSAVQFEVLHSDAVTSPKHFVRIAHFDILNVYVIHFAEHFGRVDYRIRHF